MSNLVSVRDLRVSFRLGKHRIAEAVRGVSFDIPENATVALVGESGSGKSVSAMSIVRLLPENAIVGPESRVEFGGRNLLAEPIESLRAIRGKDISVVFQEPMSSLNPVFTVGWQIAEVLQLHMGLSRKQVGDRVLELMTEVGIPEPKSRVDAYPHELSGGQQQRVMIAMAIACEPKLLIADEPTTALDVTVQRQILELIKRLQDRHRMSVLFISHDLGLVGEIADHVVVMRDGVVREKGRVAEIFEAPKDAYTKALLLCRPRLDVKPKRLPVIDDFMQGKPESQIVVTEPRIARASAATPLIEAKGLRKEYRLKTGLFARKTVEAVKDASFALYPGRTLGVVGESGSGKTTVGMLLMRLVDATAGQVLYQGKDLLTLSDAEMMAYRRKIQIIFQNPYASLNPRFTVGQILTEPMKIHGIGDNDDGPLRTRGGAGEPRGAGADSVYKYPHEFSGGQRQRIAIARCLTMKPDVVICDESVSALDVSVQATVLNLLLDLQDEFGMTYIFISHDLAVVKYMADDMLVMSEGAIVERGDFGRDLRRSAARLHAQAAVGHPARLRPARAARRIGFFARDRSCRVRHRNSGNTEESSPTRSVASSICARACMPMPTSCARWLAVKHLQSERLARTYSDLLASDRYRESCEFFLEELYGARDFEQRDAEAQKVVPKLAAHAAGTRHRDPAARRRTRRAGRRSRCRRGANRPDPDHRAALCRCLRQVGSKAQREHQVELVDEIGRRAGPPGADSDAGADARHDERPRPKPGAMATCTTSCIGASTRLLPWAARASFWHDQAARTRDQCPAVRPEPDPFRPVGSAAARRFSDPSAPAFASPIVEQPSFTDPKGR